MIDNKALVMGTLSTDAFTVVNKKILKAFDGDGTLAIVLCELISIYKYMLTNHQVDPLDAFPLPSVFLKRTMNLSDYKQQRTLATLQGGNLIVVTRVGMPAIRKVALNFDAIAKLLLMEDSVTAVSKTFYENLSTAAAISDEAFYHAMDNVKEPLRGTMLLLSRKLRQEGTTLFEWKAQHIGQLKHVIRYFSREHERFDYQRMIDLIAMTGGSTVAERIYDMTRQYKRVLQRAPEERKYSYD